MFSKIKTGAPSETPENTLEKKKAKSAKRRRIWRKLGRGALWVLAIGFVLHVSLNIYATVLLNREFADIRAKGQPLQFSEIEPPEVPDAENAALVYKQATNALKLTSQEKFVFGYRLAQVTPQDEKVIEGALAKNQKCLDLARRAAAMPQCRFPLDWKGDPTRFRFPYYAELRDLGRLLSAQATLEASKGDKAASLRDIKAVWGISHHLSKEPYLIGFLVAQSIDIKANQTLGHVLETTPFTLPEAHALETTFPQDDWAQIFYQSLIGERTMGIFAFQSLISPSSTPHHEDDEENEMPMPSQLSYPWLVLWRPFLKMDQVQTLRMWKKLLDAPESKVIPRPAGFAIGQEAAVQNAPFYAVLTKLLFPVFSRTGDIRDGAVVRRGQREVALALTCYRTLHGAYPATLKEAQALWGKPLPLDPYSKKSFIYRRDGNSFLLYSIGVNRVDDGGQGRYSVGHKSTSTADDLVWLNSRSGL